jgi:ABC-2 type transport system ATP-binding protein
MDEAERCSRCGYLYLSKLIAVGTVDELRAHPGANPPGTRRVEIETPRAAEVIAATRNLPFVHEATIFGRAIHLLIDARTRDEELSAALGLNGVTVEPVTPSLEDVFVTMTNRINEALQP